MAALISGIVASKRTPLPTIAAQVPAEAKPESRVQRLTRGVENTPSTAAGSWSPYAETLLARLALQTLVRVSDGRVVGRGCGALMLHVVYQGRALPLAWIVRAGKQGPFPAGLHIAVIPQGPAWIPPGARVVVLGDGAVDGTTLPQTLQEYQWSYMVRTGSPITVLGEGARCRCETVAAGIQPGTWVTLTAVHVTEAASGPVMLRCWWASGDPEPLQLIPKLASAEEAGRL